ncbi:hypothetical protein LAZ67_1001355 [Cordylochernes scorpioides]|uniref:Uncharacterized protein n=1 Tax=Cordylochernes scorpioides TaxID=51811 RepID=A0ABY6JXZ7_9ARAC|nr:hypothetical protein LAZ67_1001355 [Cordylochernes scorpioides]
MDKVFLHHDKASSHTSNKTQQFLQEMKDTLGLNFIRNSDIPVKSPDASPLDFYGFDLQLAAELGKTLLERNQELETALLGHQALAEEQSKEIEHLSRKVVLLREANNSKQKLSEQLEHSITELERANLRLKKESAADKKYIASLVASVEGLERRVEELEARSLPRPTPRPRPAPPTDHLATTLRVMLQGCQDPTHTRLDTILSQLKSKLALEQRLRQEIEVEVSRLGQENLELRQALQEPTAPLPEPPAVTEVEELPPPEEVVTSPLEEEISRSLLSELDEQYRLLISKYESLMKRQAGSCSGIGCLEDVGTQTELTAPTPEYKKLFEEIFSTLKKSLQPPPPCGEAPRLAPSPARHISGKWTYAEVVLRGHKQAASFS